MKQLLILMMTAILLAGCASKERNEFEEKLAARLALDPDLKDYNLDPNEVASCVVSEIAKTLPGFRGTPARKPYWEAYAAFESARNTDEALSTVKQYKDVFGSEQKASAAAMEVTQYIMHCMGRMIETAHPVRKPGS